MKVVSLFAGCGGLDLGFSKAGFDIVWANEYDSEIWETYQRNHPNTFLDSRNIAEIPSSEISDCVGIIGGPPCQSWSEAGSQRGINDHRGQLFFEYVRVLKDKQPLFFLAENVRGMLAEKHKRHLHNIIAAFSTAGYDVQVKLLNAKNYNVPQDRLRLIFVGYHRNLKKIFRFPPREAQLPTLRDVIWDLKDKALPAKAKNKSNGTECIVPNHEYFIGGFSPRYMARNRVRAWDEPSFTIQASGRHAPLHPQSNKMIRVEKDKRIFDDSSSAPYRRLSIRECARIQAFPDDFIFYYDDLDAGHKMVGNAVPINLSYALAKVIWHDLVSGTEQFLGDDVSCFPNTVLSQLPLDLP